MPEGDPSSKTATLQRSWAAEPAMIVLGKVVDGTLATDLEGGMEMELTT